MKHADLYDALFYRDFRLMTFNQLLMMVATLIEEVAVSYELYHLTKNPLVWGLMGLALVLPYFDFGLVAWLPCYRFLRLIF